MENQNDDRVKCPYCGYEMEKGAERCENCASVLKKEDKNFTEKAENLENIESLESFSVRNNTYEAGQNEKVFQNRQNYAPYGNAYNVEKAIPTAPKQLSNGFKVAFTAICVMVPIIGQFLGLVLSIIYMNSDEELKDCEDRRSFGLALLIACVVAFLVSVFWGFVLLIMAAGMM